MENLHTPIGVRDVEGTALVAAMGDIDRHVQVE